MNNQQKIAHAADVERLREVLQGTVNELRDQCFATFSNSDIHDSDGHKTCRIYLKVLEDVNARFMSAIASGKVAKKELKSIK